MTVIDEINTKNALRIANDWLSSVQYEAPYFGCGDMEAIKKALEKQIPKKPIVEDAFYVKIGFQGCPNCGKLIPTEQKYCDNCGQRILLEEGGTSD